MALYPSNVVLDVQDMARATRFWREALGYVVSYDSPTYVSLKHPKDRLRFRVGLQPAEEQKKDANPVHLDFATDDMEREAKRLEGLGATRAHGWPYGTDAPTWIVMRDPDGHEFCLVQHDEAHLLHRD